MTSPSDIKWLCIQSVNKDFRVGKSYSFVNGLLDSDCPRGGRYRQHPSKIHGTKFVPMFEHYLNQCELCAVEIAEEQL